MTPGRFLSAGLILLTALVAGAIGTRLYNPDLADAPNAAAELVVTPSVAAAVTATRTATPSPTPTPAPTMTPAPAAAHSEVPFDVPAKAVAILEAPCGALIYGKDEHLPLPPASLTKIVTALTAIGRVNLTDEVEVTVSASELRKRTRSSVMGLEPGMTVSVEDLLYGLMLPSGNDAAIAIAEHVSGSVEAFVALMNQEAARLGLHNTHLSNPHGLGSRGMRTTAYDMAIAGMALMRDPTLAAIAATPSYVAGTELSLTNGNRLLTAYPGSNGVKIGYTRSARHTIVGSALRDGRHVFVAVLSSDDLYTETVELLDWAFSSTQPQCAAPSGEDSAAPD